MVESKDYKYYKDYIEYLITKASKESKMGIVNDIIHLITDKEMIVDNKKTGVDLKMGLYSLTKANLSLLRLLIWIKIKNVENNK